MAQQVKEFNFASGNIEAFLANVVGMNIVYRNRMRNILKSEDNEMPRMRELFITMVRRQEAENVHLMNEDFKTGFVKLFNMNATQEMQIVE